MVQGHDDAAGPDPDALGCFRQHDAGEGRILEDTPEGMEVALGNPHGFEPVAVCEQRALPEQVELPTLELGRLTGEKQQAEAWPGGHGVAPPRTLHRRWPHMYCSGCRRTSASIS